MGFSGTRRRIVSCLGYSYSLTHLLIQKNWGEEFSSDDVLPDVFPDPWKDWCRSLLSLESLSIPRQVSPLIPVPVKHGLHIFTDASEKGFGAAVYLRAESESSLDVSLYIAKARVAPIKFLAIPSDPGFLSWEAAPQSTAPPTLIKYLF